MMPNFIYLLHNKIYYTASPKMAIIITTSYLEKGLILPQVQIEAGNCGSVGAQHFCVAKRIKSTVNSILQQQNKYNEHYDPLLATTNALGCMLSTDPSLLSQKMRAIPLKRNLHVFQFINKIGNHSNHLLAFLISVN